MRERLISPNFDFFSRPQSSESFCSPLCVLCVSAVSSPRLPSQESQPESGKQTRLPTGPRRIFLASRMHRAFVLAERLEPGARAIARQHAFYRLLTAAALD